MLWSDPPGTSKAGGIYREVYNLKAKNVYQQFSVAEES